MRGQTPIEASSGRPLHHRIALLAALVLVLLGSTLVVGAFAQSQSDDVQIQVTECGDDSTTSTDCGGPTQIIEAAPAPAKKPAPSKSAPAQQTQQPATSKEVQSYDLTTGKGTVTTDTGVTQAGTIEIDPSVKQLERRDALEPSPAPVLPTVQTSGGSSPFAGFGSGYSFVTSNEALARFAIPPFLQPIYQAAGKAYGVPWNVLAAINSIETDFGRIENQVSSAGALGWMQFMPGTWKLYGVDATGDGVADPWNPVDAIYAAARYLKAAGAATDLRKAILAYNHADWYADSVLKTASIYGSLPSGLVAETGSLAYGRFPLRGAVTYGDDFRKAQAAGGHPHGLRIDGADGAKAIATQDVTVRQILLSPELAATLQRKHALRSRGVTSTRAVVAAAPARVTAPAAETSGALAGAQLSGLPAGAATSVAERAAAAVAAIQAGIERAQAAIDATAPVPGSAGLPAGFGRTHARDITVVVTDGLHNTYRYEGLVRLRKGLRPGLKLKGGQAVGYLGKGSRSAFVFAIRAAGGAPVDPRPLVDGYRLQEAAGFQHVVGALGANPFLPSAGEIAAGTVSGSDRQLARRVLDDPGISIYPCGRQDIMHGDIDRRVLGALLYLRKNGMTLTVTSLHCGHGYLTASGNVSAHSYGAAVDIAAFNGQPVLGHQGPGSLIEHAIRLLMQLKGNAAPSQLISLMALGGPSFALADHYDHLHVGYTFQQSLGLGRTGDALGQVTFNGGLLGSLGATPGDDHGDKADERKLSDKLGKIRNPKLRSGHGSGSIHVSEVETAADVARAEQLAAQRSPLRTQPTSAGAAIIDADVAQDGHAFAVGTVDGAGHDGWAKRQTVLLAQRDGAWALIGAPRNAAGKVVNPSLRAIAALPGDKGYAAGADGAVVRFAGESQPRQLARVTKADLGAIDARRTDGRSAAYAVGARGAVVRLSGAKATLEHAGTDTLSAVVVRSDGTAVAAASGFDGHPTIQRRENGSWSGSSASFDLPDGARIKITSLADDPSGLWAAGGITDAAATGEGVMAPFVSQLAGGRWTTWCAGSPALTAVRELGTPTARACDSTLSVDPAKLGPAGDVAYTSRGVVVATPSGIELHNDRGFRLVPDLTAGAGATSVGYAKLALSSSGSGWAIGSNGAMARVLRAASAPEQKLQQLAAPDASTSASIGVTDNHVLTPAAKGLDLDHVAWSDKSTAWALDDNTGTLVRYRDERWSVPGASSQSASELSWIVDALGGNKLPASVGTDAGTGLRSLAFSGGSGLAVGDHGALRIFLDGQWAPIGSPTSNDLLDVAMRGSASLIGGAHGTLIEAHDGSWQLAPDAGELAAGRDITAVAIADDGTELAAAGGAILERHTDGKWQASTLPPLGLDVVKLRGYRADGALHVLALVRSGSVTTLLDGDGTGWRPVGEQLGAAISDFTVDAATGKVWIAGRDGSGLVAAQVTRAQDGTWTTERPA